MQKALGTQLRLTKDRTEERADTANLGRAVLSDARLGGASKGG
jgi:hypothetical protein